MRDSFKSFLKKINVNEFTYTPVNITTTSDKESKNDDRSPLLDIEPDKIDSNFALTNYFDYTGEIPTFELPKFSQLDYQIFGSPSYSKDVFSTRLSVPQIFQERILTKRNEKVTKEQLLSLVELFKAKGVPVTVTSLERPGAKTSNKSTSWHATGQAMDIVPTNGDFSSLLMLLESDPEIRMAMANIGVGYLDETTDKMLNITKGTGKHIHIGPDHSAIAYFNKV